MKRLAIIMTIFLLATVSASAQRAIGEDTVQELQKRSSAFIALIYQSDYQKAFDFIRGYPSSISTENLDSLQASAAVQLEDIKQIYGEKLEVQYIGYNSLSNFLLRFVYVIRYEWHLVWWQVVYYRGAEDAWLCTSVSYENDYEALFDLTY
jgi:hypothetical protein